MKYKVGDQVRIKSLDWYNENKGNADKTNSVWCKDGGAWFFYHMSQYCGKVMTIEKKWALSYTLEGSDSRWTDEMIEGLAEEPVLSAPNISEGVFIPEKDMKWTTEWNLPEGYIFKDEKGNVINIKKIVLEKLVKPKFKVGDRIKKKGAYISGVIIAIDIDNFYKVEYGSGGISYVNSEYQDEWELVPKNSTLPL